jgi:mono/diheme cytochrome c family protein
MKHKFILIFSIYVLFSSCSNDGRGYEYMPNMYRSPSLETYGKNNIFSDSLNARKPVAGTIARGYLKTFNYSNDLEGYLLAGRQAINPFEKNDNNMKEGQALYGIFCVHCHGPNGAGGGSITHPVYSAVPHYNDNKQARRSGATMSELTAGHLYHAITFGLNAMGPHASQITENERWQIVLYVQELQKYSNE